MQVGERVVDQRSRRDNLEALPGVYPNYFDLPPAVLSQHRMGVAQVLSKLGEKGLYKELTERDTLQGISAGTSGLGYSLLSEAFLTDTQNYRAEQINAVFSYLAISNVWAGVEKHVSVVEFMRSRDPSDTPRTILNKLVKDRNDASHSEIAFTLGPQELISTAQFLIAVVTALSEIVRKQCVELECSAGKRLELCRVVNVFSSGALGVKFLNGRIAVGDQLLAVSGSRAYTAGVVSIQRFDVPLENADAETFSELGLRLDVEVARNARLLSFHKLDPVVSHQDGDTGQRGGDVTSRFHRFTTALGAAFNALIGR